MNATQFFDFKRTCIFRADFSIDSTTTCGTTRVERTQGKLCTRFTDGLSGDDTYSQSLLNKFRCGQVASVALSANTALAFASQYRANFHFFDTGSLDGLGLELINGFSCFHDDFTRFRIRHIVYAGATHDTIFQCFNHFICFLQRRGNNTAEGHAIHFVDDHVLCNVHQTTGEVTGIGRFQSRIGKTLTRTVGRDEVLQNRQTFFEVCQDGVFDNVLTTHGSVFLWLSHQTTHTGELTNLFFRTTRSGVKHHVNTIESFLIGFEAIHEDIGQLRVGIGPDVNHLVITFVVGDKTHVVAIEYFLHFGSCINYEFILFSRDHNVGQFERQSALKRPVVTNVLHIIEKLRRAGNTHVLENVSDDITKCLLGQQLVDETHLARYNTVKYYTTCCGFYDGCISVEIGPTNFDIGVKIQLTFVKCDGNFLFRVVGLVFAQSRVLRSSFAGLGNIIKTQYHVL